jgi:hypothetical protein
MTQTKGKGHLGLTVTSTRHGTSAESNDLNGGMNPRNIRRKTEVPEYDV